MGSSAKAKNMLLCLLLDSRRSIWGKFASMQIKIRFQTSSLILNGKFAEDLGFRQVSYLGVRMSTTWPTLFLS